MIDIVGLEQRKGDRQENISQLLKELDLQNMIGMKFLYQNIKYLRIN